MRSNIEIKARCADLDLFRQRAAAAGARTAGVLVQRDTYFRCSGGRLKLRITDSAQGRGAELIRYLRADDRGPRQSRYDIKPVRFPPLVRCWLSLRRGRWVEVRKRRELWLWRGVRIHLDEVDGLGNFIELEAVVAHAGSLREAGRLCDALMEKLDIAREDLVELSYSDMQARAQSTGE